MKNPTQIFFSFFFLFSLFFISPARAQLVPFVLPLQIQEIDYGAHSKAIYGEGFAPGVYTFRNLNSDLCAFLEESEHLTNGIVKDHLVQGNCSNNAAWMIILPSKTIGEYIIKFPRKGAVNYSYGTERLEKCASVARGVIFGAPAIDSLKCDLRLNAISWADIGVPDQSFRFIPVGGGYYEIRTNDQNCWALRDASKEHGAGIIKWQCTSGADQRWKIEPYNYYGYQDLLGLGLPKEVNALAEKNWYLRGASFVRAKPVGGWNYSGSLISKLPSDNDSGKKCAISCLDNATCKAFSWRPIAIDNSCNGKNCCSLFTSVYRTQSINDGSYSGLISR